MRHLIALLALLVATLVLAGCGSDEPEETPGLVLTEPETGHVHALGVDPADGTIVVAAHNGLFRAAPGEARATRLGDDHRDAMGFTVEGPRRYAASGHPDPRAGGPPSVGFIRSTDGGRTWRTVSLEGEADLHVLESDGDGRVHGFDALSGRLLSSRDGGRTWRRTEVPPLLDLAVDPRDPDRLAAVTERGLIASADGGRGWRPAASVPPGLLAWTREALVLVGLDGRVRTLDGPSGVPRDAGAVPLTPAAVTVHAGELLVAGHDGAVVSSRDGGRSWRERLAAAR